MLSVLQITESPEIQVPHWQEYSKNWAYSWKGTMKHNLLKVFYVSSYSPLQTTGNLLMFLILNQIFINFIPAHF